MLQLAVQATRADTTTACSSAIAICLQHIRSFRSSYTGQRYYSFIPWPQCWTLGVGWCCWHHFAFRWTYSCSQFLYFLQN